MSIDSIIGLFKIHKRPEYIFPICEIIFTHLSYSKHLVQQTHMLLPYFTFSSGPNSFNQHSGGKLLKAVQSFYVDSKACVRVGNDVSDWFLVNVGLRQSCVMYPWLFNVYMDGVVPEVNVRVLGKGFELLSANGGRFEINQLLFADDTALVLTQRRSCLDWWVSSVEYAKEENWEWM